MKAITYPEMEGLIMDLLEQLESQHIEQIELLQTRLDFMSTLFFIFVVGIFAILLFSLFYKFIFLRF